MKIDWPTFKKDKFFFFKYFLAQMILSFLLLWFVLYLNGIPAFEWQVSKAMLIVLPFFVVLGIQLPAMLHNAVHFNIRPRWLNELVGEVGGFFVLFGLGPFRISHFLHHAFADSHRDPHPPQGHGFLKFLITTQVNTIKVIREEFLKFHGRGWDSHMILVTEMGFYYISLVVRIAVWISLLGPAWFVFAYLPAYVTNVLVFAHINYATHETQADGRVEVINLNNTWYHKLVNFVGSGVYFHKNHHEKPFLYNPSIVSTMLVVLVLSAAPAKSAIFDRDHRPMWINQVNSGKVAWRPLDKNVDKLTGVGVLGLWGVDLCTTFLLDTGVPSGPAYIATNAHCTLHKLGFNPLKSTEVRTHEGTVFDVTFNHYAGVPPRQRIHFKLAELAYYTESGMDLSIFRVKATLGEMRTKGITPLKIAPSKPKIGARVKLVGVPLLRVPSQNKTLFITDECVLLGEVAIRNGEYLAPHSMMHNCSSIEGFSGGPFIEVASGNVVLINSHGAAGDSTDAACTYATQPCELRANGEAVLEIFHNYAQYVDDVVECFDASGNFDLRSSRCGLPK